MAISAPVWGGKVSRGRDFAMRTATIPVSPSVTRAGDREGLKRDARAGESAGARRLPPLGQPAPVRPLPRSSRARQLERRERARREVRDKKPSKAARYLVVAAVGFLLGVLALVTFSISAQASKVEVESPAVPMVTVRSGDSLWSIAQRAMPQTDPRDAVNALRQANDIKGSALTPGQVLRVP